MQQLQIQKVNTDAWLSSKFIISPNFVYCYFLINVSLIPQKSRATALLALTGDGEFNRDIRSRASQLGMLLNLHGLWKWYPNGQVTAESQELAAIEEEHSVMGFWGLLKVSTEEAIFAELGLDYIDPHKRNFEFIMKPKTFQSSKR